MILKPNESPLNIDVHWLSHFTLVPQQGAQKGRENVPKFNLGHASETSGSILIIQTLYETL